MGGCLIGKTIHQFKVLKSKNKHIAIGYLKLIGGTSHPRTDTFYIEKLGKCITHHHIKCGVGPCVLESNEVFQGSIGQNQVLFCDPNWKTLLVIGIPGTNDFLAFVVNSFTWINYRKLKGKSNIKVFIFTTSFQGCSRIFWYRVL